MLSRLILLTGLLALGACSTLPEAPELETGDGTARWEMRGKVGIWSGETRESARVSWLQCGDALRIDISGAVGGTAARLSGDQSGVTLQQRGKPDRHAPNADALLADLGWPMPASALRWWIFARPVPGEPHEAIRNEQGRWTTLQQSGWTIAYDRYRDIEQRVLPAVVDLQRADLRFKFLIAEQDLSPATCDNMSQ